tara:strand:+ start:1389 stop:1634 length:246 start_codon:yes stop_codon:yes gene_type:complete
MNERQPRRRNIPGKILEGEDEFEETFVELANKLGLKYNNRNEDREMYHEDNQYIVDIYTQIQFFIFVILILVLFVCLVFFN